MAAIAADAGMRAVSVHSQGDEQNGFYYADWILVTANQTLLSQPEIVNNGLPDPAASECETVDRQLQQRISAAQVARQIVSRQVQSLAYSPKLIRKPNRATRGEARVSKGVLPASIDAIKQIISSRKGYQMVPEVMGSVGTEAEVAMQQILVGIIVKLPSADPSLQAEQTPPPAGQIAAGWSPCCAPPGESNYPPGSAPRRCWSRLHPRIDSRPRYPPNSPAGTAKSSDTPRLSIWPRFSRLSSSLVGSRTQCQSSDRPIDLRPEVADPDGRPDLRQIRMNSCLPPGCPLRTQIGIGQRGLRAHLPGAVKLILRGRAVGAKCRRIQSQHVVRRRVMPIRGSNTVSFNCGNWTGAVAVLYWLASKLEKWSTRAERADGPGRRGEQDFAIHAALTLPGGGVEVTLRCGKIGFVIGRTHIMDIGAGQQQEDACPPADANVRRPPTHPPGLFRCGSKSPHAREAAMRRKGLRIVFIVAKEAHHQIAPIRAPGIPPEAGAVDLDRGAVMAIFIQYAAA